VFAGLLVFVSVAAGCGGGSGKLAASDFADKTCSDLATWGTSVSNAFSDINGLSSDADQSSALRTVSSALGDVDQATAKLAANINGRQAPNVASGAQIKTQLVKALNDFRDKVRNARTKIDNFNPDNANSDDADSFSSAMDQFGSDIDSDLSSLSVLSDNSQLRSAFTDSNTCKQAESVFSDFSS
jgi:hypothetical protein